MNKITKKPKPIPRSIKIWAALLVASFLYTGNYYLENHQSFNLMFLVPFAICIIAIASILIIGPSHHRKVKKQNKVIEEVPLAIYRAGETIDFENDDEQHCVA